MKKESIFKRVINFYSGDLKSEDIERLFMKDTPERYKYFVRKMDKPSSESKSKFSSVTTFIKNFTETFLKTNTRNKITLYTCCYNLLFSVDRKQLEPCNTRIYFCEFSSDI